MATVQTTTPKDLKAALTELMRGITPTYEKKRESLWMPYEGPLEGTNKTRAFWMTVQDVGTNAETMVHKLFKGMDCDIVINTVYSGFTPSEAYEVASQDFEDLAQTFSKNLHPRVKGLITVDFVDDANYTFFDDPQEGHSDVYEVQHVIGAVYYKSRSPIS